uniref:Uncharacterized protein n=1 Tax=Magallana gigas TaxID=29159 RepID=K1REA0_MAGGI
MFPPTMKLTLLIVALFGLALADEEDNWNCKNPDGSNGNCQDFFAQFQQWQARPNQEGRHEAVDFPHLSTGDCFSRL